MMKMMKLKERQRRRLLDAQSASFPARRSRITQCTRRSDIDDDDDGDDDDDDDALESQIFMMMTNEDKDTDDDEYGERTPLAQHSEGSHLVLFTHQTHSLTLTLAILGIMMMMTRMMMMMMMMVLFTHQTHFYSYKYTLAILGIIIQYSIQYTSLLLLFTHQTHSLTLASILHPPHHHIQGHPTRLSIVISL